MQPSRSPFSHPPAEPPPRPPSGPPILNTSPAVRWLIVANLLVHLARLIAPAPIDALLVDMFSFVSGRYTIDGAWALNPIATVAGPLTHQFLHADFTHLIMNMVLLLAFGTPASRHMTARGFIALYLICGVAGAALWTAFNPGLVEYLVGASGAISGMLGAVARLSLARNVYRRADSRLLSPQAALSFVVVWVAFNVAFGVLGLSALGMEVNVAWEAHLGGFVAGFVLAHFFDADRRAQRL